MPRKTPTTRQLARNVIAATRVVETGTTSGGKAMRLIVGPFDTIEGSVAVTASIWNVLRTIPISRYSG